MLRCAPPPVLALLQAEVPAPASPTAAPMAPTLAVPGMSKSAIKRAKKKAANGAAAVDPKVRVRAD